MKTQTQAGWCIPFLVFFIGIGHIAHSAPESGKVTVAVGDVKAIPPGGGAAVAVKPGQKITIGFTIKTGPNSRAVIVITPRAAIRVAENSEVVVATIDETVKPNKVLLDLKEGGLGALLKTNAADELDFRIKTPSGVAAARGTFYSVFVKDGKGYAQVKEGRVAVIPGKAEGEAQ